MKVVLPPILLCLLFISFIGNSQSYNWEWTEAIDGGDVDNCRDVAYDTVQNLSYTITNYKSDLSSEFGPTFDAAGNDYSYLAQVDDIGNISWVVNFTTSGSINSYSLDTDHLGNIYVVGSFTNDITITSTNSTTQSIGSSGGSDAFICKVNSLGIVQWLNKEGGTQDDYASSVKATSNAVYVTGAYSGTMDVLGALTLNSNGGSDAFIGKYSLNGTELEFESEGSNQDDVYTSVSVEGSRVICGGYFEGNIIDIGGVTNLSNSETGTRDGMISTYNSGNLSTISALKIGGIGNNTVQDLVLDNSDTYVVGTFENELSLPISGLVNSANVEQGFIAKINDANVTVWVEYTVGSASTTIDMAYMNSLAVDQNKCYVLGNYNGTISIDGTFLDPSINMDLFISTFDKATGAFQGVDEISGSSFDSGSNLDLSNFNEIFLVGQFKNDLDLNGTTVTASGLDDAFWSKLICSNGTATISAVNEICNGEDFTLNASFTGSAPYTFSIFENGIDVGNYSSATTTFSQTFSPSTSSSYQIDNLLTQNCSSPPSNTINVSVLPTIGNNSITADQNICAGDVPNELIGTAPINGSGTYTYLWEESTDITNWGPATGLNYAISYQPPTGSGIIYYRRIVESLPCQADTSNLVTISFGDPLSNNTLPTSLDVCENISTLIDGSTPIGGNNIYLYEWEISTDNITWNSASGINDQEDYSFNNTQGTFYLRRYVQTTGCSINSSFSNTCTLTVHPIPVLDVIVNDGVCEGTSVLIEHNLTVGQEPWQLFYNFDSNQGNSTPPFLQYNLDLPAGPGSTYIIDSIIDANGCSATINTTYNLIVNQSPTADAGSDIFVCGEDTLLQPNPSIGVGTYSSATISIPSTAPYTVSDPSYGTHEVYWEENFNGCIDRDTLLLRFDQPIIDFQISDNDTVYTNDGKTIVAQNLGYGNGVWSLIEGDGLIATPNEFETYVNEFAEGLNKFRFDYANGVCPIKNKKVSIFYLPLVIPSGISPNGDGQNDYFEIRGLENFETSTLRIFNQWGQEIFYSPTYNNDWNGTAKNGSELPSDSYFYILTIDDQKFDGYIILNR